MGQQNKFLSILEKKDLIYPKLPEKQMFHIWLCMTAS